MLLFIISYVILELNFYDLEFGWKMFLKTIINMFESNKTMNSLIFN